MEELPFERAAMKGEEMPDELCLTEQKTYLCLRSLYADYYAGKISREAASMDKQKIIKQMEEEKKTDNTLYRISQLWTRIEESATEYAHKPSVETADKFYAAVYGLSENWRLER